MTGRLIAACIVMVLVGTVCSASWIDGVSLECRMSIIGGVMGKPVYSSYEEIRDYTYHTSDGLIMVVDLTVVTITWRTSEYEVTTTASVTGFNPMSLGNYEAMSWLFKSSSAYIDSTINIRRIR